VAVDGELVAGGQGPALVADRAELRFAGDPRGAGSPRDRPAGDVGPGRAVGVEQGVGRVDEMVPKLVERFEESPLKAVQRAVAARGLRRRLLRG
jgi:hypothetical protein